MSLVDENELPGVLEVRVSGGDPIGVLTCHDLLGFLAR